MSIKMLSKGQKKNATTAGSVIRAQVGLAVVKEAVGLLALACPACLQQPSPAPAAVVKVACCSCWPSGLGMPGKMPSVPVPLAAVQIPYIKADIPILILFRALGAVVRLKNPKTLKP
jgi:hypothetical protein